jgi:hypothetical protein
MKANCLTHSTPHAIANRRLTRGAGNSETDASSIHLITRQAKRREKRAGESYTLIIYSAELAAAENAGTLRKAVSWCDDRDG